MLAGDDVTGAARSGAGPATDTADAAAPGHATLLLPALKLRGGVAGAGTLFLLPGSGGDGRELAPLAEKLTFPGPVVALSYLPVTDGPVSGALARQAGAAIAAMHDLKAEKPWQLLGYSFGALVAAEAARQLGGAGIAVPTPILIDAYYDQKFWPASLWTTGVLRRTGGHLARIVRLPPAEALRELRLRAVRLSGKLAARLFPARSRPPEQPVPPDDSLRDDSLRDGGLRDGGPQQGRANFAAFRAYDPGFFPGGLILLGARDHPHFDHPPEALWTGRCDRLQVGTVTGDHLGLLRNPASLAELARVVDSHLQPLAATGPGPAPLVLLVASFHWATAADLATALQRSGFRVAVFAPPRHPIRRLPDLLFTPMPLLFSSGALCRTVTALDPALILPCDEPSVDLARSLPQVRPERWPPPARAAHIALARAAGVRAPATQVIASAADLTAFIDAQGLPVVLKTDGSLGGRGVAIARTRAEAEDIRGRMARGRGLIRTLKRLVLNADTEPQMWRAMRAGRHPTVNAQAHVAGQDANIALSVWQGRILSHVCVKVLEVTAPLGPARVIEVIDHPEMLASAAAVMRATGMTGLVGLDFLIDDTGAAHLIEVNPRATTTCRLRLGPDHAPIPALRAMFPAPQADLPPDLQSSPVGQVIELSGI